ncbi:hypothetical protein [Streptomyces sp. NPDC059786]|uniref:hypothetical protein n=1 Tax=Streptomyces sp. NPDC059786 TaxID=3346946 RepID=UPI0036489715
MLADVNDQRFHLVLHAGARPVMHGWWPDRGIADGKFTRWVGKHGGADGARITLTDEETGRVIHRWPKQL